jgi:hypothetical protein
VWWASAVAMTAALAARVPELGPAWDARNSPQTAAEEAAGGRVEGREDDGGHQNGSERPLWWRRWFGG